MKVYKLDVNSNNATHFMYKWEIEEFKNDRDCLFKLAMTNQSLIQHLNNIKVEKIVDETSNTKANFSRFMGVSVHFILDEKTKNIFESNLKDKLEFIPVTCEGETLYLLYVMESAKYDYNNLVREKAQMVAENKKGEKQLIPFPGRVLKFAFEEEEIADKNIFRPILDAAHKTDTLVSEEFKQLIEKNNLTGFKFIEIWDSAE